MEKRDINNALRKYFHPVLEQAGNILPRYNIEEIHNFRTAVKRFRALQSLEKDVTLPLPSSFKKVYRAAGSLRDLQVQLRQLVTGPPPIVIPRFCSWLSLSTRHARRIWYLEYDKDIFTGLLHSIEHCKPSLISVSQLDHFFSGTFADIRHLITHSHSEDVLHEIRKKMKTLMYVAEWAKEEWDDGWEMLKPYDIHALKARSDLAGVYNDLRIGLEFLTTYLKHEKAQDALRTAALVADQWMLHKRQAGKHLVDAITDTFGKAKR